MLASPLGSRPTFAATSWIFFITAMPLLGACLSLSEAGRALRTLTSLRPDCYVCEEADGDCARHLFQSCQVGAQAVLEARSVFGLAREDRDSLGLSVVRAHLPCTRHIPWASVPEVSAVVMEYLGALREGDARGFITGWRPCSARDAGIQAMITWALWRLRQESRLGIQVGPPGKFVTADVLGRMSKLCPQLLTDEALPGNSIPRKAKLKASKVKGSIGSAGRRSPAQKALARKRAKLMVDALPANAVQVWSDGAANPNPGPAGAGAVVILPGGGARARLEVSLALGHSTNNVGEIVAVGAGVLALRRRLRREAGRCGVGMGVGLPRVHIFTDSMTTKALAESGGSDFARKNARLMSSLWALFRSMRGTLCEEFVFHHVGGHCGIPLNDDADRLAGAGASRSAVMGARGPAGEDIVDIVGRDGEGFLSFPVCD